MEELKLLEKKKYKIEVTKLELNCIEYSLEQLKKSNINTGYQEWEALKTVINLVKEKQKAYEKDRAIILGEESVDATPKALDNENHPKEEIPF